MSIQALQESGTLVRCSLCHGCEADRIADSEEFPGRRVLACQACGLMFLAPSPSAEELAAYYQDGYRLGRSERLNWQHRVQLRLRAQMQIRYVLAQGAGADAANTPSVLDVGCGAGFLLHEFQRRGWRAIGIEPDQTFAEWGREQLGAEIVAGVFPAGVPEAARGADLIVLSHSLEHVVSPVETLAAARDVLSASGRVYVEVPRVTPAAARVFAARSPHTLHFQGPTLRRTLEAAGFHVLSLVGTAPRARWLPAQVLARRRTASPDGGVARSYRRVQRARGRWWWRALRWCYFRASEWSALPPQLIWLALRRDSVVVHEDPEHPEVTVLRAIAATP